MNSGRSRHTYNHDRAVNFLIRMLIADEERAFSRLSVGGQQIVYMLRLDDFDSIVVSHG